MKCDNGNTVESSGITVMLSKKQWTTSLHLIGMHVSYEAYTVSITAGFRIIAYYYC